jgi:hypothetical protein
LVIFYVTFLSIFNSPFSFKPGTTDSKSGNDSSGSDTEALSDYQTASSSHVPKRRTKPRLKAPSLNDEDSGPSHRSKVGRPKRTPKKLVSDNTSQLPVRSTRFKGKRTIKSLPDLLDDDDEPGPDELELSDLLSNDE